MADQQAPKPPSKPAAPAAPSAPGAAPKPPSKPAAPAAPKPPAPSAPAGAPKPVGAKPPVLGAPKPAAPGAKPGTPAPKPAVPGARPAPAPAAPGGALGQPQRRKIGVSMADLKKMHGKQDASAAKPGQAAQAPQLDPSLPIEERVIKTLKLKEAEIQPSEGYKNFIEKIAPKFDLARTSYEIINAFSNIDVTADKVAACLEANPYYEFHFYKILESMGKKKELLPKLQGAVVMLGMQNTRNTIVSMQLLRGVSEKHPEWDKNGKQKNPPTDVVRFAIKTEEQRVNAKAEYADIAYAAGLVFDIMMLMATEYCGEDKKKVYAYIEQVYNHCLKTAVIAEQVAETIPDFAMRKYLFAACLLHDIAQPIHAIFNSKYLTFVEDTYKKEMPRAIRHFIEQTRFGMSHAVMGSVLCESTKIFAPISKAILYHHEPYLLRNDNASLYQLACVISLSTNIANHFRKTDKANDPILQLWRGPDLAGFSVNMPEVMRAVAKLSF